MLASLLCQRVRHTVANPMTSHKVHLAHISEMSCRGSITIINTISTCLFLSR